VLADFRVYLNTFLLKSYIHYKLNMLGLILTTTPPLFGLSCFPAFSFVLIVTLLRKLRFLFIIT